MSRTSFTGIFLVAFAASVASAPLPNAIIGCDASSLLVNEVSGAGADFAELLKSGPNCSLDGWRLVDGDGDVSTIALSGGLVAGGLIVLTKGEHFSFGISANGEAYIAACALGFDPSVAWNTQTTECTALEGIGATTSSASWGRPSSGLSCAMSPTPGVANACCLSGCSSPSPSPSPSQSQSPAPCPSPAPLAIPPFTLSDMVLDAQWSFAGVADNLSGVCVLPRGAGVVREGAEAALTSVIGAINYPPRLVELVLPPVGGAGAPRLVREIALEGFEDTEGLTWLGDGKIAIWRSVGAS
jgi:hypothetical protein